MSLDQMTRMAGSGNPNREKDDFYATPVWAIDALLDREAFEGEIWEPACGGGGMLAFAWFVFNKEYNGKPRLEWI